MKDYRSLIIYLSLLIGLMLSCSKRSEPRPETPNNEKQPELIATATEMLSKTDSLTNFSKLLTKLTLNDNDLKDGVTILAPINSANIPPMELSELNSYIIKGIINAVDLKNGAKLKSINGSDINVTIVNLNVFVNGVQISTKAPITQDKIIAYPINSYYQTAKPNVGVDCDDPNSGKYYISYYEDGVLRNWNGSNTTVWSIYGPSMFRVPVPKEECAVYFDYYGGPGVLPGAPIFTVAPIFSLQLERYIYGNDLPRVGTYTISDKTYSADSKIQLANCNLLIGGDLGNEMVAYGYLCGKDSYVNVNVTEVKIEKEWPNSTQKRGYYKGTFEGIIYAKSSNPLKSGNTYKKIITQGQFMSPIAPTDCTKSIQLGGAPIITTEDKYKLLTSGRWYFNNQGLPACNLDDYMLLRTDGTFAWIDGGTKCGNGGEIDYVDDRRDSWSLVNNSVLHFNVVSGDGIIDYTITKLTSTELILSLEGAEELHFKR